MTYSYLKKHLSFSALTVLTVMYKTCKTPVKSSPPTNQYPTFYRPDALPIAQPTVSIWHCWLGDRKGIRPVKSWVLVCWWWWF